MPTRKKAEKKEKLVEIELTNPLVKYDFSQDELVEKGEQVAELASKLGVLEAEAKQIARKYKSDIEGIELNQAEILRHIRDKFEMKSMECFKVIDAEWKKVYFFRTDQYEPERFKTLTQEQLRKAIIIDELIPARERDLRPSEVQRELPLEVKASEKVEGGEKVETK